MKTTWKLPLAPSLIRKAARCASTLVLCSVLVCNEGHCLTTNSAGLVQYTAFDNSQYVLRPWLGRNVAFLTPTNQILQTNVMGALLTALDAAWDYYRSVTPTNR